MGIVKASPELIGEVVHLLDNDGKIGPSTGTC